ncbi:MAG: DUF302 domain-containing protein [Thiobacillus sp.]
MSKTALAILSAVLLASPVYAVEKLVSVASVQATKASMDRLEKLVQARGLKVFARIDHAAGAHSIGEKLRPTELLIFGHPKGGTPLLQCAQSYGIDLPLHVLAWEDSTGQSWLSYKDMAKLGHHHPDAQCDAALKPLTGALDGLVNEAAKE